MQHSSHGIPAWWWQRGIWAVVTAVSVIIAGTHWAQGTSDSAIDVTIRCEALQGRQGVTLRVLHATPLGIVPLPAATTTFDTQGECHVQLPEGEYLFEAAKVDTDAIIALRSEPRRIAPRAVVELKAAPPQPLSVKSRGETLPIREIAVRSAAVIGEVAWTGDSASTPPLLLSPGQSYRLRLVGGDDTSHFAVWPVVSSTKLLVPLDADGVYCCTFNVRQDGPDIAQATVRFQFPDGNLRFEVRPETRFLTNRRFLSFGYGLQLANGKRLAFRPWLGLVKKDQEFVLGGPLTPAAWARIMVRKPVGGPETRHLVWDANLYDPTGHMVMAEQSQIQWHDSVRGSNGSSVPRGRPLTKEDLAAFVASGEKLVVDVSYDVERPVSVTLQAERFRPYGSRRFHTTAPPRWELQALNYLSRAERVFHMVEDLEGKLSKHRVEVRWHAMNGTAWGCAPAGGNAHIMMPFSGLRGSFNFYETPWALAHEMLHTFGYGHGDRMSRMTGLVERRFDQYRWFMADHPQHDPETAFMAFRAATRLAPGVVTTAAPKKGKKGKKKKG